jgi:beta-glucanase (GH16 family)
MIRSKTTFHYGYFEARIKLPGGLGVAPAFWLNSARRLRDGKIAWPPEIDIFEFVINGVEDKTNMLHTGVASTGPQGGKVIFSDTDFHNDWNDWKATYSFADDFHIFAGSSRDFHLRDISLVRRSENRECHLSRYSESTIR